MTDTPDRSELRRLAEAATPGPWTVRWPTAQGGAFQVWGKSGTPPDGWAIPFVASGVDLNMAYVAALDPDTVRSLLDALDSRDARIASLEVRLHVLTRLVQIAHDDMPERLNNHTRVNVNEAWAYARGGYSSGLTRDLEAEARAALGGSDDATGETK